ncbi:MAG: polyprenyl synthetase family protein [Methylocystaceae bacterium]
MKNVGFLKLISREMEQVEKQLHQSIDTEVTKLAEASSHLLQAGGKRLRPAFVLLTGSLFINKINSLVPMATAMELMHMASLVHDDVIDNSSTRRGYPTVKAEYGNRMSIYAGDYSLARALSLAATYQNAEVNHLLAQASIEICEGEIDQMRSAFNYQGNLKSYLRRIHKKTALLIALSCQLGAILSGAPRPYIELARLYGYYLGMAFQITDDILDYTALPEVLGKPTGSDLKQGIITLPAYYALRHSGNRREIIDILSHPVISNEQFATVLNLVVDSGGIEYSQACAANYIEKTKRVAKQLPDRPARQVFVQVADFVLEREY